MQQYQKDFIEFVIQQGALKFGDFTLKSGRKSPYFFNSGVFNTGETLAILGGFYAAAIKNSSVKYDVLFGPAYKGIPLVCTTAIALAANHHQNSPYCFNRKEAKDHGEGGNIVGAPLKGKILIIDDVITAGTAIRESMQIINSAGAELAGVVIAMDRQERGQQQLSAIQEIEQTYHTKVISIIKLENIVEYLTNQPNMENILHKMQAYKQEYGSNA